MPLPGGGADKAGNAYELLWTCDCLTRILRGQARCIRLEPVGTEGQGVEFWLEAEGCREYHQAKRQQAGKGHWTIADLAGVLANFKGHLDRDPESICVFVSTEAAAGLRELAERAKGAQSSEEFRRDFLQAKDVAERCSRLKAQWACSDEDVWALLRHIRVHTVDHDRLDEDVATKLSQLATGNGEEIAAVLIKHVLDNIHQTLDEASLWQFLTKLGHHPTDWAKNESAVLAVTTRVKCYLKAEPSNIPVLKRTETDAVFEAFTKEAPNRLVFLTGDAGTGKSGVAAAVVRRFRKKGWPVLPFRLDLVEPVITPQQLGQQLKLPSSPVTVLNGIAGGGNCLLVVDQLDAVSLVSGRNPQFFECFRRLLDESRVCVGMRVLVVCRGFDLQNDSRLRQLVQTKPEPLKIEVGRLGQEVVRYAVSALGLQANSLSQTQLDLLSVPLHLVLLANVVRDDLSRAFAFQNVIDLYDGFWAKKREALELRGRGGDWVRIIRALTDTMSRRQTLSVPEDALIDYERDVQAMVSEHVLRRDGHRLSFFHEGFFDYAFARLFTGGVEDLVLDGEQHLFQRGQLRRVLRYRHDRDHDRFCQDVAWLLRDGRVRFHLRQTAILVLSELTKPGDADWTLLEEVLTSADTHFRRWGRRALFGKGWGRYLCQTGRIRQWLSGAEDDRSLALDILDNLAPHEPALVARELAPFVDMGDEWPGRIVGCLGRDDAVIKDDDTWTLILRLSERTLIGRYYFDGWSEKAPERCCILLARQLLWREDELDDAIRGRGETLPFAKLAEAAPEAFVRNVLPVVLAIIEANLYDEVPQTGLKIDAFHWSGAFEPHAGLPDRLFDAASNALGRLAQVNGEQFRGYADQLRARPWQTAQVILCKALALAGQDMAAYAGDVVLELLRNFAIVESYTSFNVVRDVLASMAACWDQQAFAEIETEVLKVRGHWEGQKEGYQRRGQCQRLLLEAIPEGRLSALGRRRLGEWRRMPGTSFKQSRWGAWRRAVSPITAEETVKMPDKRWLSAVERHNLVAIDDWRSDDVWGGAEELAQHLQARTKEAPARFAALALRFPIDTHPAYFRAVLRGVLDSEELVEPEVLLALLRQAHGAQVASFTDPIVSLIGKYGQVSLHPDMVVMLAHYAADPDPSAELWRGDGESGSVLYGGSPLGHGMNTVRGDLARTVASLLFSDPARIAELGEIARRLLNDPSIAVRACAIEICTALLNVDRDWAVRAFLELVAMDDVLLVQQTSTNFLMYALWSHHQELMPLVSRLLSSDVPEQQEMGGLCAAVVHVRFPENEDGDTLAQAAVTGPVAARKSAAHVYAQNWEYQPDLCHRMLAPLFRDEEKEVRTHAAIFVHRLDLGADAIQKLVSDLIHSPTFLDAYDSLFRSLEKTAAQRPALLLSAVDRFLETAGEWASDIRPVTAVEVGPLVIRAYSQSSDEGFRAVCLDHIDALIGWEMFEVDRALEDAVRNMSMNSRQHVGEFRQQFSVQAG